MSHKASIRKGRQKRAGRGTLTRESIIAEALFLLDRDGLEAITMRRLALHLGVSPMALYNHIAGKDDLLQGVARSFIDNLNFSSDYTDWRERILACFRELRRACLAHPGAVRLLEIVRDPPLLVFLPMEITLSALDELALRREDAVRAYFLLMNFVMGQLAYEVRGPFKGLDPAEPGRREKLEAAGYTYVGRATSSKSWDFERAFEFGVSTILAGLTMPQRS